MNLPSYFLADLPAEAPLAPGMLTEACRTLKRNRAQFLAGRSTGSMVEFLAELGANWRRSDYPFRALALEHGPESLRFSRPTLERGLDAFFAELHAENLQTLLLRELGHAQRLDAIVACAAGRPPDTAALARGPELLVHVTAGKIPVPALASMVLGLLVRSAQFVKCATGASLLPRLFAHSIYEADRKLGACLELAEWPGGKLELEAAVFAEADCVTATGTDAALDSIRLRLPLRTRFLGYGHRVSFGYVAADALSESQARQVARQAARDVSAWDQLGCLSPHLFYVEERGAVGPRQFASMLAEELAREEIDAPRGRLPAAEAASIACRRDFYRVRSASSPETQLWCSEDSTAWTVVFEEDPAFQLSCLHRFVYVKPAPELAVVLRHAEAVRGQVSTVGLAASSRDGKALAEQLAHWGVTRICPIGRMQQPPLTWRHDGRPALADMVQWTDWEHEPAAGALSS